jgi:glycosyltransferase involved in cell wall biosynthesis
MNIAIVHDYFTQLGGAEKVAEELYCMFPESSLFATVALPNCMPPRLAGVPIHTSWMQKLPQMKERFRFYFPFYPLGISALDLSEYDLVLSSSSGYAKGVKTRHDAIHVCYCHTPTRWIWNYQDYSRRESFGPVKNAVLPVLIECLKHWDQDASRQPDHFVANSRTVATRIKKIYERSAHVIHPPIDIDRFHASDEQEDYYIVLSRLVGYKQIDLAVRACTQLERKLLILGDGPDRKILEQIAGPTVKFLGRISDREVEHYVSRCRALLFPGEEDFGMAPLEVAAAGRPTIAYRAGGAVETIMEGVTGAFFDEQTPECLADAMERFEKMEWSPSTLRQHAECFSVPVFRDRLHEFLRRVGAPVENFLPYSEIPISTTYPVGRLA